MENSYPKTPIALFIQLYCKKRVQSQGSKASNKLVEATKSWITLSHEDKNIFISKYNEGKRRHREKFADYLGKTEPYMKKKKPQAVKIHSQDEPPQQQEDIDLNNSLQTIDYIQPETNCNDTHTISNISNKDLERSHTSEYLAPTVVEPRPPEIRNSMEFFEVIKAKSGVNHLSWSTLSNSEKRQYQRAVYQLKKNYIRNYKAYLESLSSKELFSHYNKVKVD